MTDLVAQVHGAPRASVVAPAGCGKTHLLACVVGATASPRPQLVLTHTHAGVDSLRRKLAAVGGPGRAQVETIAGWSLRATGAYPSMSGVALDAQRSTNWAPIYDGARRLIGKSAIREMLTASYSGVLVDEYQDCTAEQHGLVAALAEELPCRVFGDPLQAIFDFDPASRLVEWDSEVFPSFPRLHAEGVPYRWANTNPELGRWLLAARPLLEAGAPIKLSNTPVEHPRPEPNVYQQVRSLARATLDEGGTVMLIRNMKNQCQNAASRLGAPWHCIDAVDDRDAITAIEEIVVGRGPVRAAALVALSIKVASGATNAKKWAEAIAKGGGGRVRTEREQFDALQRAADDPGNSHAAAALRALVERPGVRVHRRQLYRDALAALDFVAEEGGSGADAVWCVRNAVRHRGRPVGRAGVGRTLLVKGLEFDHVIVLDAEAMNARNLYVALSRGSRRVTVISPIPTLTPRGK